MSDLESVDLSQESEAEGPEDMLPFAKDQPTAPVSHPTKKTPIAVPQRTQRDKGSTPAKAGAQNGTVTPERRLKTRLEAIAPPSRPATTSRPAGQAPRSASQRPIEKPLEKPAEKASEPSKTVPGKAKRGRPRKVKQLQRIEEDGTVSAPQAALRSAPGSKPTTAPKSTTASKPTAASRPTAASKYATATEPMPASKATSTPKPAAASRPTAPAKTTSAPRQTGAVKPAEAGAPRTGGRGRKRRLATKPVEATQEEHRQDNAPGAAVSDSQQLQAPEKATPPQKPAAKPAERKLYGAAKAAVMKRKREEEARAAVVPVIKSSRGKKKDSNGSMEEVEEIPRSPPQKGRPAKRVRRLPLKEAPRPVPQEVIRIEDDDILSGAAPRPVTSLKVASARPAQMRTGTSQEHASSAAAAPSGNAAPPGNAAPSRGRQSLPSSFARPAGRRSRVRDEAFAASRNRQPGGTSDDFLRTRDEGLLPEKAPDTRIHTQDEFSRPANNVQTRRTHAVRHSTGNIGAMDTDDIQQPGSREDRVRLSKDEAVKSLLDEIQRNAIPFLLAQDRICDSFSARIGEDADVLLRNSDDDVFEVFTDRVKDALVVDRLRLAVASAKTDLRRGMERLLREFARKAGAPLTEADSSLLLRNEVFRNDSVKEERRGSKPPAFASPRNPRNVTPVASRRVAEDSNYREEASDGDDLSDAGDPIITTPRRAPTNMDIPSIMNVADLRKFVGYSYDNLNLGCYRSCAILKLCAQPGGMTVDRIHELTPLGKVMIKNKAKDLIERGYLVEDVIREDEKDVTVYSTAVHVSDT